MGCEIWPIINRKHVQHVNPLLRKVASGTVRIKTRRHSCVVGSVQLSTRRGDVCVTLAHVCLRV